MPDAEVVAVGVGLSSSATAAGVRDLVEEVLTAAGLRWRDVTTVATDVALADDARLTGLGPPVVGWPRVELAGVDGVTPSQRVADAIGTPSVAEAAAVLAAGPAGRLVVPKRRHAGATAAVAVAR